MDFPFRFTKTSVASCSDSLCKRTLSPQKKDGPFFQVICFYSFLAIIYCWFHYRLLLCTFPHEHWFFVIRISVYLVVCTNVKILFLMWQRSVSSSNSNKTATAFSSTVFSSTSRFVLLLFDDPPLFYTSKKRSFDCLALNFQSLWLFTNRGFPFCDSY